MHTAHIQRFLKDLRKNTTAPYRLTVVDNNSTNASADFLKGLHDKGEIKLIRVTPEENSRDAYGIGHLNDTLPQGAVPVTDGQKVMTHGQCLDVALSHADAEKIVTIDTDVLVKPMWLERMLSESDAACVGQSKTGPHNTSRIWVANCLYDRLAMEESRTTMQPVRLGSRVYDTGDFQSTLMWLRRENRHVPDFEKYWHHISSMHWFYNCLRSEPKYADYKMFNEDGTVAVDFGNRPLRVILTASWWYQKLYVESLPNDVDIPWLPEDHLALVKRFRDAVGLTPECDGVLEP